MKFSSERVDKFDGEQAGFLGQGLGAGPIAGFAGFVGLGEEAANFFLQILLRGVQDFAVSLLQIFLRDVDVFARAAAQAGLIAGRKLRRDLRRRSTHRLLGWSIRGRFGGLTVRRRRRFGVCRLNR